MLNKIFRWLITALGLVLGYTISRAVLRLDFIKDFVNVQDGYVSLIIAISVGTILFGLIFYLIAPLIIRSLWKITELLENGLQKVPTNEIIVGVIGLIVGLLVAFLLSNPVENMLDANATLSMIGSIISLTLYIIFGTLGVNIAIKKKEDLFGWLALPKKFGKDKKAKGEPKTVIAQPKVLDTSVIIDGRILDILKTGFVEGTIVIPSFVLEELRHIADSADSLKRTRGRRGLDILNEIQKEVNVPVEISERDFPEVQEVDSKLLKLAQAINGKVITNDFNLNKVAEFQGVAVLNINELANAIKPVVIPGEEMNLHIVKDGKESGQGVAYLDDGTMIVVEGGRKHVGEIIDVIVTSVLQTAAGRMIFARVKGAHERVG